MAQVKPKYPQVTKAQIEIWESNPVTKVYIQCLNWKLEDVDDVPMANLVDSSNSDLTHANIHENLGQQQGITTSADYLGLLDEYGMIEEVEDED